MANIEKLLAMGTAQGADPTRMLIVTSGAQKQNPITWEDVRLSVGALEPHLRAILQLRAVPQFVSAQELAALTLHLARGLFAFEHRRAARIHATDPVARAQRRARHVRQSAQIRVALCEYLDPRTCRPCRGEGKVLDHVPGKGVKAIDCPRCAGRGWKPWSENRRASAVGGDRNAWRERYAPGYEFVLRECSSQYREAEGLFKARLFGAPDHDETPGAIERRMQARC